MRALATFFCYAVAAHAQWVMATSKLSVAPDVHSVYSDSRFVYVESAGLSLHSFGRLEANEYDAPLGPRALTFRIPREPKRAAAPMNAPLGVIGVFVTGVPIYNPIGTNSYNSQNIWHEDAVAASRLGRAAGLPAIVGYALDGFPILGATGLRSSYRLREITKRTRLPDGTVLAPGQEGPEVGPAYPLGAFAEDYEFVAGSGDLDESNGRMTAAGYAYFVTDTWPYMVGQRYYGEASVDVPGRVAVLHSTAGVDLWSDRLQIEANSPVRLSLDFKSRFLENVHERPVHMVIVSKDLEFFDHVHPSASPGDLFSVCYSFPAGGEYWVYADYSVPGAGPRVARFSVSVRGSRAEARLQGGSPAPQIRFKAPLQIEANRDVEFGFELSERDWEPWLGAWAHIMIVSRDGSEFIHAHPLEGVDGGHTHALAGPAPSAIRTQIGFKKAGAYRLWFQYQRHGEVFTVPFDISVAPGAVLQNEPKGVTISSAGFSPPRISVPAGRPSRIAFTRLDAQNCVREVVFPELGIRKPLPVGETVYVDLPARPAGELRFACGMGMYKGAVIVRQDAK
jgi:hypothetical protein